MTPEITDLTQGLVWHQVFLAGTDVSNGKVFDLKTHVGALYRNWDFNLTNVDEYHEHLLFTPSISREYKSRRMELELRLVDVNIDRLFGTSPWDYLVPGDDFTVRTRMRVDVVPKRKNYPYTIRVSFTSGRAEMDRAPVLLDIEVLSEGQWFVETGVPDGWVP